MPSAAFQQLMERVESDAEFAKQLHQNHEAVLAQYDLTDEEKQTLLSGDEAKLQALGVDERVSKAYYYYKGGGY